MRLRRAMDERDRGFSLVELLVVIIIIGILAAIAIPVFLNQRKKGVDAGLKSDLKALALAQETWVFDNPDTIGVANAASVQAAGFTASPGNTLLVSLNPTTGGYCLLASNTGASVANNLVTALMLYDSTIGGIVNGGAAYTRSGGTNPPIAFDSCGAGRQNAVIVS